MDVELLYFVIIRFFFSVSRLRFSINQKTHDLALLKNSVATKHVLSLQTDFFVKYMPCLAEKPPIQ